MTGEGNVPSMHLPLSEYERMVLIELLRQDVDDVEASLVSATVAPEGCFADGEPGGAPKHEVVEQLRSMIERREALIQRMRELPTATDLVWKQVPR